MWTAVLAVAAGCQTVPEEFSAPTWTPVAAVPLVDTRFDLSDVLEVLTDSLDTVPVATTAEGELAFYHCLLYTSPSPRDATLSRMPSSA